MVVDGDGVRVLACGVDPVGCILLQPSILCSFWHLDCRHGILNFPPPLPSSPTSLLAWLCALLCNPLSRYEFVTRFFRDGVEFDSLYATMIARRLPALPDGVDPADLWVRVAGGFVAGRRGGVFAPPPPTPPPTPETSCVLSSEEHLPYVLAVTSCCFVCAPPLYQTCCAVL